jgi:hypothetical protein
MGDEWSKYGPGLNRDGIGKIFINEIVEQRYISSTVVLTQHHSWL